MKRILNYFKRRREQKLRKWCIEKAIHSPEHGQRLMFATQEIYDWVTICYLDDEQLSSRTEQQISHRQNQ